MKIYISLHFIDARHPLLHRVEWTLRDGQNHICSGKSRSKNKCLTHYHYHHNILFVHFFPFPDLSFLPYHLPYQVVSVRSPTLNDHRRVGNLAGPVCMFVLYAHQHTTPQSTHLLPARVRRWLVPRAVWLQKPLVVRPNPHGHDHPKQHRIGRNLVQTSDAKIFTANQGKELQQHTHTLDANANTGQHFRALARARKGMAKGRWKSKTPLQPSPSEHVQMCFIIGIKSNTLSNLQSAHFYFATYFCAIAHAEWAGSLCHV